MVHSVLWNILMFLIHFINYSSYKPSFPHQPLFSVNKTNLTATDCRKVLALETTSINVK